MEYTRPVLIAAVPRSGSSLIAGIFAAHGLWIGNHHKKNMANTVTPYDSYENEDINRYVRKLDLEELRDYIEDLVPHRGFLYKASPYNIDKVRRAILPMRPFLIKVHRKFENILLSSSRHKEKLRVIQLSQLNDLPGPVIDSDAVIGRDFETLRIAFKYCDMQFDHELADQQIDDSLWHHR